MSLYQGPGVASSVSDDCSFLFHEIFHNSDANEKEKNALISQAVNPISNPLSNPVTSKLLTQNTHLQPNPSSLHSNPPSLQSNPPSLQSNPPTQLLAAIAMSGPLLVQTLPVPNESSLLKRWKEASSFSTKFPQKAEVGSIPVGKDGIQMSFTPWKEAAFLSKTHTSSHQPSTNYTATANTSTSTRKETQNRLENNINNTTTTNNNNSNNNSIDIDSFDKRFILKLLHKQCPLG
jgi:hypothetical protein